VRIMHPVWIIFLLATITVPGGWMRMPKKPVISKVSPEPVPCLEEA